MPNFGWSYPPGVTSLPWDTEEADERCAIAQWFDRWLGTWWTFKQHYIRRDPLREKNDWTYTLTLFWVYSLNLYWHNRKSFNLRLEEHIPVLVEGWAALSKAEGQPVEFFLELRGLESMPNLLDSIGMNEWEWGCSFDLPTGYTTRVVVTQGMRDDDLWWTLALVSPEGNYGSISFTVGTVGGEGVARVIRIVETALCHEGYDVFEGTDAEWETYLQALGKPV